MADRYFVTEPIQPGPVILSGVESHHLLHVMRAKPGDQVVLFDGTGAEFKAVVESTARNSIALLAGERLEVNREASRALTLAVSLPKGDRQKWLVEKAVEIGIARIVPLTTARSVAQPTDSALDKLRRAVIESSKQCGRNRLLQITEPQTMAALLQQPSPTAIRLFAHPDSAAGASQAAGWKQLVAAAAPNADVCIAIGPEGGFSDSEATAALAAGWQRMDLGARILRVETAAIYLAALVQAFDIL